MNNLNDGVHGFHERMNYKQDRGENVKRFYTAKHAYFHISPLLEEPVYVSTPGGGQMSVDS